MLAGIESAEKTAPGCIFFATPETARLITPGNLEDNLAWCGEVDWIIEAVAENLEIKRKLFEDALKPSANPRTITSHRTPRDFPSI